MRYSEYLYFAKAQGWNKQDRRKGDWYSIWSIYLLGGHVNLIPANWGSCFPQTWTNLYTKQEPKWLALWTAYTIFCWEFLLGLFQLQTSQRRSQSSATNRWWLTMASSMSTTHIYRFFHPRWKGSFTSKGLRFKIISKPDYGYCSCKLLVRFQGGAPEWERKAPSPKYEWFTMLLEVFDLILQKYNGKLKETKVTSNISFFIFETIVELLY